MNVIEPIADAATGGIVARAVEPDGGIDQGGHTTERACLNCGTVLTGDYCHVCGQRGHVHRSLRAFFHDLLHGVFHFEGKIWRTLPMLAWRPGELTRRYVQGQRASFVSPIALFLFTVFLMFAAVSMSGIRVVNTDGVHSGLQQELADNQRILADLQARRAEAARTGQPTAALDQKIGEARGAVRTIESMEKDGVVRGAAIQMSDDVPKWLAPYLERAGQNPELLFFKLKTNAYKFSWMLIPLSVPFLWLLFPFSRRFHLYDHTIFVTYSLSFMTLLVVAWAVLMRFNVPGANALWLLPPFHMYRQLKGAYGLSRASAVLRTIILLFFTALTTTMFLLILTAIGIFE